MPTDPHDEHDPQQGDGVASAGTDEPAQVGPHPVLELWDELEALVGKLAGATTWSMSNPQARASVAAGDRVLAAMESAWLAQVRDLDSRPDAVTGARPGHVARTFLIHALNRSGGQAGADVRAARALDPDRRAVEGGLPELGAAFAAGQVSRRHVDAAERVMSALPSGPARAVGEDGRTGAERVEEFLADKARVLDPDRLGKLGRDVLARLDPNAGGGYDADAYRRRYLSMGLAPDGMTVGRFALPAAQGAALRAVLESFSAPQAATEQPGEDGQPVLIADERTLQQRRADALIALARAAANAQASQGGAEPAQVTILTDLDQLAAARATTDPHPHHDTASDTASDTAMRWAPRSGQPAAAPGKAQGGAR